MIQQQHVFDLEQRTFRFACDVRDYIRTLSSSLINQEYFKQLIRASSSIGANYIEANEALSKKDFIHRIRISRKETKECIYWLRLLLLPEKETFVQRNIYLIDEAMQLVKIFSSIITKSK